MYLTVSENKYALKYCEHREYLMLSSCWEYTILIVWGTQNPVPLVGMGVQAPPSAPLKPVISYRQLVIGKKQMQKATRSMFQS
jgi:hypothetical protein